MGTKAATMTARWAVLAVLLGAIALFDPAALGAMNLFEPPNSGAPHVISTDPVRDATVVTAPSQVTMTFNEVLQSATAQLTVMGADHFQWSTGTPRLAGANLSVAMRSSPPPGLYTVSYKVISDGGDVVSGAWRFSVGGTGATG